MCSCLSLSLDLPAEREQHVERHMTRADGVEWYTVALETSLLATSGYDVALGLF